MFMLREGFSFLSFSYWVPAFGDLEQQWTTPASLRCPTSTGIVSEETESWLKPLTPPQHSLYLVRKITEENIGDEVHLALA